MSIASLVQACLPQSLQDRVRPVYHALRQLGCRYFCPVCELKVRAFLPIPPFYAEQLARHGSSISSADSETCNAEGYSCPNCGAADRDRLYALYLSRRLGEGATAGFRLLDIAPAAQLSALIRRNFPIEYRTADLHMQGVDDKIDLTHMDFYADASFDAFICSHVLEHVTEDRAAMSELFRILKPGGWGIAMVPISLGITDIFEDPTKTTEAERWKFFGQHDHVRLYSRSGFLMRLRQAGFRTHELGVEFFGEATFESCGIARQSILYVVGK